MAGHGSSHPLVDGCPPEWASAWGDDQYGIFVEFRVGEVDQRMRWIGSGKFLMGSLEDESERRSFEQPQHEVRLARGYWLADTPVTQALWEAVTGDNPSHFKGDRRLPVEQVSWEDCQRYCAALGERVAGPAFRLPTEAEWEYACRAGTRTPRYGDLDEIAWYRENSASQTHSVKTKAANPWGLYDMVGNVWEWCSDRLGLRTGPTREDTADPAEEEHRVIRGGAWHSHKTYIRSAALLARGARIRDNGLGLRLARDQG